MGWSCIHTWVGQENRIVEDLHLERPRRNGEEKYEAFCPHYLQPLTGKQEFKEIPLFPGYVFVFLNDGQRWHSINSIPGVIRLITDANRENPKPLVVPDVTIVTLRHRLTLTPVLKPGTKVIVRNIKHCFVDFEGTVVGMTKEQRVKVCMSFLNRDQEVVFDCADLEPI